MENKPGGLMNKFSDMLLQVAFQSSELFFALVVNP
jgi:hypothetical protein